MVGLHRRRGLPSAVTSLRLPVPALHDIQQFHLKDQRGVGGNPARAAALAVGELRRNEQLPLVADLHQLQGFRPTWDDSVDRKLSRLAALDRAVEHFAVDERAVVVGADRVGRLRTRAVPFFRTLYCKPLGNV